MNDQDGYLGQVGSDLADNRYGVAYGLRAKEYPGIAIR
jgi:hypothetical protein